MALTEYDGSMDNIGSYGMFSGINGQSFTTSSGSAWEVNTLTLKGSKSSSSSGTKFFVQITDDLGHSYCNDSSNNSYISLNSSTRWECQKITIGSSAVNAKNIKLMMAKVGAPNGNVTVSIQAEGGGPSGVDLISGTINTSQLTTLSGSGDWVNINFGATGITLSASTVYYIIIKQNFGTSTDYVTLHTNTAGTYSGGERRTSNDSGNSWDGTTYGAHDIAFWVYGTNVYYELINTSTLPAYTASPSFYDISLSSSFFPDYSKKYYFIIAPQSGNSHATAELAWSYDSTSPSYTDGESIVTSALDTSKDRNFKVSGIAGFGTSDSMFTFGGL
jgi:hypothetical protein